MRMPRSTTLILLICATLISSSPAQAQFFQQGPRLQAQDSIGLAEQGTVAVSADGNTAIVGGTTTTMAMGGVDLDQE